MPTLGSCSHALLANEESRGISVHGANLGRGFDSRRRPTFNGERAMGANEPPKLKDKVRFLGSLPRRVRFPLACRGLERSGAVRVREVSRRNKGIDGPSVKGRLEC